MQSWKVPNEFSALWRHRQAMNCSIVIIDKQLSLAKQNFFKKASSQMQQHRFSDKPTGVQSTLNLDANQLA